MLPADPSLSDERADELAETLAPLAGSTVLVTGAAGFIGRHLLARLAGLDLELRAVSRRPAALIDPAGLPGHWLQADLADRAAVARLVDDVRPDVVFHLASHVAGSRDLALVPATFDGNLASTVHLLEAVARQGLRGRFVFAGSLEEPDLDGVSIPASPYAAAKSAATGYVRMFQQLYQLPTAIARIFMVYGHGAQDEKKLVPYVIRQLLAGHDPQLSSGLRPVDWIAVDDVVEGLLRLAVCEQAVGRRVDLGTGRLETIREVVERLYQELAPAREPRFGGLGDRPAEQVRAADVVATQAVLGWHPRIGLEEGLRRAIDYFRAHPPADEERSR